MRSFEGFYNCGNVGESQILRYRHPDVHKSGVVTTFKGGLITARHVAQGQNIPNFTTHQTLDIAYRPDDSIRGLPLGWVDVWGLDAELVTTSVENPDRVVSVLGHIGITLAPTDLLPFDPHKRTEHEQYIKPGASGSPLVYDNHIIGILPGRIAAASGHDELTPGRAMAVVFNGEHMKEAMEHFGLTLPARPLIGID
ncbi:MAG TPA: hypothetical protein VLE73_01355 [Candidatus Saccharimonadales bacterium]|nr:hypothetical protein [Candidatus Saccharimonadales bacterium]